MDIEIKKEKIVLNQKKATANMQTNVESDIIVPDIKPDIRKVTQVDALVKLSGCEVQNDRLLVYGKVSYQIVYMSDEEKSMPKSMSATATFTDVSDINGIAPGMFENITAELAQVDFKVINGRKMTVRSVVDIKGGIYGAEECEAVSSVENAEGFEKLEEEIKILNYNKPFVKSFTIEEKIVIPTSNQSAEDILKVGAKISDRAIKIINNKVIIKGETIITTLYSGAADGELSNISNAVAFTEILDVDGISENSVSDIVCDVTDVKYQPEINSEGEIRVLSVNIDIECRVRSYDTITTSIVKDCYCTTQGVKLSSYETSVDTLLSTVEKQLVIKDNAELGENAPKIKQVYDAESKAFVDSVKIEGQKVTVSGSVDAYLLYVSEDENSPLYSAQKEMKFEEVFEVADAGNIITDINAQALNTTYSLNNNSSVEIRCNVKLSGIIADKIQKNVISNVQFVPLDESASSFASITVYFVQKGDTLWNIAKKYHTTVCAIMEMNNLDSDLIYPGDKLYIPKYKKVLV